MDTPLTKRVTMIELFYDLVFAYMISQATALIHHLDHGLVSPVSFLIFAIVVIVFINSWMVQSVFTNRYGSSSWLDIGFYFIDMMILLFMTNAFDQTSARDMRTFFLAASCLSLTLLAQYLIVWFRSQVLIDRQIARAFSLILLLRTLVLLIGGLFNTSWGRAIALVGIIISWWLPSLTGKYTKQHPIIFSHLLERLTLLIIMRPLSALLTISNLALSQWARSLSSQLLPHSFLLTSLNLTTWLKKSEKGRPATDWFTCTTWSCLVSA